MFIAIILLADDKAAFVEAMTKRLKKRDLDITAACGSPQALKYSKRTL